MQNLRKHGLSRSSAPPWGTPGEKRQESPGDREMVTSEPRFWYQSLTSTHWFGYPQVMGSSRFWYPPESIAGGQDSRTAPCCWAPPYTTILDFYSIFSHVAFLAETPPGLISSSCNPDTCKHSRPLPLPREDRIRQANPWGQKVTLGGGLQELRAQNRSRVNPGSAGMGGSPTCSASLPWKNSAKKEEICQKKKLKEAEKVTGLESPGKHM